jgi:dimethylamine monooxygenase subunit A
MPPELPFAEGSWRLTMGLKPLALADWIEMGDDPVEQMQVKHQLWRDRLTEVFASLSGSETAQQEVLDLLIPHLLHYFPQAYERQGNWVINHRAEQRWCLSDFAANPLDLAGRLVQEDLCLMLPSDRGYLLSAASLCFPSRWRLHEKLGKPAAQTYARLDCTY